MLLLLFVVVVVVTVVGLDGTFAIPAGLPPRAVGGDPKYLVEFKSEMDLVGLEALGYDVLSATGEVIVSEEEYAKLSGAGYQMEIRDVAHPLMEDIPEGYRDLAAIERLMFDTEAAYPSIAKVYNLGDQFADGLTTFEGRSWYAIKISDNVGVDEDEENILIQGMHHAREIITPEVCLDAITRLTSNYGKDSNLTYLVDNFQVWIWPVVNPDGLEYVWNVNNLWRKNRKPNLPGTSYGVDNNRNYDLGWDSSCGGSTSPSSDTYRGPSVHSEEENQMMVELTQKLNFRVVADFHSYGREVLYNYLCNPMPPTVSDFVRRVSNDVASKADYATRLPSADGGHCQWTIKTTTLQCFLFETEIAFQPSYSRCLAEIERLWPAVLDLLLRPSILNGHVRSATTNAPVLAQIYADNVPWQMGETRYASGAFGRYHYALPSGSYQFRFVAAGYQPFYLNLTLDEDAALTREIYLQPLTTATSLMD